jgi:hypothetical protein
MKQISAYPWCRYTSDFRLVPAIYNYHHRRHHDQHLIIIKTVVISVVEQECVCYGCTFL